MSQAIEIITYKLNQGINPAEYVAANRELTEWAKALPGFKSHTISVDANGLWTEALYWETMEHATAAHDRFMMDLGGGSFLPMIDKTSFTMNFGEVHVMETA